MKDEELHLLFKPLWDDLSTEESFWIRKPLLAHYTSIQTMEQILRNDQIWLSNPLFMNDVEELRFGTLEGVKMIVESKIIESACNSRKRFELFRQHFDQYFNLFANDHALDTYVFCLSEHSPADTDGLLSMWRGYGGNGSGAAIVLDTSELKPIESSAMILAKVHYATADERRAWLTNTIARFAEILIKGAFPDEELHLPAFMLFERIKVFALYTKHPGFSEEMEWRITYLKTRDPEGKLASCCDYAIGPRGAEPKLKFNIKPTLGITSNDLSLERLVHSVVLGPSVSSPIAQATVVRMLQRIGKNNLAKRVRASGIPFRAN